MTHVGRRFITPYTEGTNSMKAYGSNESFKTLEGGTYLARCYRVIDMGRQEGEYMGERTFNREVWIAWETPTELIEGGDYDGQPYSFGKSYTNSLGKKANLRKDIEAWRGVEFTDQELRDGFDLHRLLGQPCMITLKEREGKRPKVTGVTKLPRGMTVPPQVNPSVLFDLDAFDPAVYNGLSDWFKETIAKSPEYKAAISGAPAQNAAEPAAGNEIDGIPF